MHVHMSYVVLLVGLLLWEDVNARMGKCKNIEIYEHENEEIKRI